MVSEDPFRLAFRTHPAETQLRLSRTMWESCSTQCYEHLDARATSACNVMGQMSMLKGTDDNEVWSGLLGADGNKYDLDNFGSTLELYEGVRETCAKALVAERPLHMKNVSDTEWELLGLSKEPDGWATPSQVCHCFSSGGS